MTSQSGWRVALTEVNGRRVVLGGSGVQLSD